MDGDDEGEKGEDDGDDDDCGGAPWTTPSLSPHLMKVLIVVAMHLMVRHVVLSEWAFAIP